MQVLVLCTGNSCRSQMAEAFINEREGWLAVSAGTHPAAQVNARAVAVMKEIGIDMLAKGANPKTIESLGDRDYDWVWTVCDNAHESCPRFPGKARVVHIGFPDPPVLAKDAATEEDALVFFRQVRDDIKRTVDSLPGAFEAAYKA